ncbi:hypothetical protein FV223_11680, partial [Methylobacterium sp. WL116]
MRSDGHHGPATRTGCGDGFARSAIGATATGATATGVSPRTVSRACVHGSVRGDAGSVARGGAIGKGTPALAMRSAARGGTGAAADALPIPRRRRNPRASAEDGVAANAKAVEAASTIHPICEILRICPSVDPASLCRRAFTKAQETESTECFPRDGRGRADATAMDRARILSSSAPCSCDLISVIPCALPLRATRATCLADSRGCDAASSKPRARPSGAVPRRVGAKPSRNANAMSKTQTLRGASALALALALGGT